MAKSKKVEKKSQRKQENSDAAISESLSAIYGDQLNDLKTVARAPGRFTRFLVRTIVVLTVLCFSVIFGFLIYNRWFAGNNDGKPLALEFVIPDDIQSGTATVIELDYKNQTRYPLTAVGIDMNLPSGFIVTSSEPEMTNASDLFWDVGTIGARSDGKILLHGIWHADVPSTTGVQALVAYKPANFNAEFHDIISQSVTTTTSTMSLVIDAPEVANVGESVTYTVHVLSEGELEVVNPVVNITLPEGFFLSESEPALLAGDATEWTLPGIAAGTEGKIRITGTFASDVSGQRALLVTAGIGGSRFSPQASATSTIDVRPSALALTIVGNGATGNVLVEPGGILRLTARIDNRSDAKVSGASVLFDFTAEDNLPIIWSDALIDGGRITAKGIVYEGAALGDIASGEYVVLNLSLPIKTDLSAGSSTFQLAVSATHTGLTVFAAPLQISVNSDAAVSSAIRYYDENGSVLGSGPLPPVVGSLTHYRALWTLNTGSHALEDIRVTATLPEDVVWDDFYTTAFGTIIYHSDTRMVEWKIASLPESTGQITARMSISVTPTSGDVGLEKTLLGRTTLQAKDTVTRAAFERVVGEVTSACIGDSYATGKGQVQEG